MMMVNIPCKLVHVLIMFDELFVSEINSTQFRLTDNSYNESDSLEAHLTLKAGHCTDEQEMEMLLKQLKKR